MFNINKDDVPSAGISDSDRLQGGEIETKMVFGNTMSMMYAERPEDYHSRPHVHDSEQFNYLIEGKLWIFIEDEAFLMEPGDLSRIPEMKVHWSKVEDGPCAMVESHSPPYIGDPDLAGENQSKVVGLFSDSEDPIPIDVSENIWAADFYADHEQEMMDEYLNG